MNTSPPMLSIAAQIAGQPDPAITDWRIPLPPHLDSLTLRDLIAYVVTHEVDAFRRRQRARELIRLLSPDAIARGITAGKIDPAAHPPAPAVDTGAAITTARQAFEDGLYFVFVDGAPVEALDDAVTLRPDSRLLFVRLIALAGG